MAESAGDAVVNFELLDPIIWDGTTNLYENLTKEEQEEVDNVVTLLDSAKSNSLDEFDNNKNLARHKPIDNSELDRLAGKNSTQSTAYQTKWALSVIKDKYYTLKLTRIQENTQNMTF